MRDVNPAKKKREVSTRATVDNHGSWLMADGFTVYRGSSSASSASSVVKKIFAFFAAFVFHSRLAALETNAAMAIEWIFVCGVSARESRMIGTRAPTMIPPLSPFAK